jgi:hypothetical protein
MKRIIERPTMWFEKGTGKSVFSLMAFLYIKERLEARNFGPDWSDIQKIEAYRNAERPEGLSLYIDPEDFCERFSLRRDKGIDFMIYKGVLSLNEMEFEWKDGGSRLNGAVSQFFVNTYAVPITGRQSWEGLAKVHFMVVSITFLPRPIWGKAADIVEEYMEAARNAEK